MHLTQAYISKIESQTTVTAQLLKESKKLLKNNIHFLDVSIVGKLGHLSNHM
jgi:hypothetical protein